METRRGQGVHKQGAVRGRDTAPHEAPEQHEGLAHELCGQDSGQEEGHHRDRQRRAQEHGSDRTLQTPLRRQLLGESCRRPLRLLLLPQEADDRRGQVLLFGCLQSIDFVLITFRRTHVKFSYGLELNIF